MITAFTLHTCTPAHTVPFTLWRAMHAFPHRSANTIKLVDVSDFKELAATVIEEEHGAALQHLQFTRDGSILSASSTSGCLYVERDPLEEIERCSDWARGSRESVSGEEAV